MPCRLSRVSICPFWSIPPFLSSFFVLYDPLSTRVNIWIATLIPIPPLRPPFTCIPSLSLPTHPLPSFPPLPTNQRSSMRFSTLSLVLAASAVLSTTTCHGQDVAPGREAPSVETEDLPGITNDKESKMMISNEETPQFGSSDQYGSIGPLARRSLMPSYLLPPYITPSNDGSQPQLEPADDQPELTTGQLKQKQKRRSLLTKREGPRRLAAENEKDGFLGDIIGSALPSSSQTTTEGKNDLVFTWPSSTDMPLPPPSSIEAFQGSRQLSLLVGTVRRTSMHVVRFAPSQDSIAQKKRDDLAGIRHVYFYIWLYKRNKGVENKKQRSMAPSAHVAGDRNKEGPVPES